ncbi:sodium:proton exchanger [Kineosporia rhizophila]|uniref:sodium:proton exchanger n=1 Tax=Kineosporia rhizophila TaxID=84633 RepID=UPI0038CC16FD
MTTTEAAAPPMRSPRLLMLRSIGLCTLLALPAIITRLSGAHPEPVLSMILYGVAVFAASFLLAWAAEAAQVDISGGLAIAILALIAVLPEYAVDLYYAYTAGSNPEYVQYAAANMTGSNRLLLGLGWPVVVLVGLWGLRRLRGRTTHVLPLNRGNRLELGFLLFAGIFAFVMPLTGEIHLWMGVILFAWFAYYAYRLSRGAVEEPHLQGTSAAIGGLPRRQRRLTLFGLFLFAAFIVMIAAEPFAHSLVDAGADLGIDEFLLVQWVAPLASEAPEFIIAIMFAWRGNAGAALATLISSKVNQWTLLVGSLPIAYLAGGGETALQLDHRQTEEMLLTAAQTMMGIALILGLRFHHWSAWILLLLFMVQFPVTGTDGRLILSAVYGAIALAAFAWHWRHIWPTLKAPFAKLEEAEPDSSQ